MTSFTTKQPVRIMFPTLVKPRAQNSKAPEKFSVMVLVHKTSPVFEQIKQLVQEEMAEKFGSPIKLAGRSNPVKSCKAEDAKRAEEGKEPMFSKLDDAENFFFFNASSSDRPGLVDGNLDIIGPADAKSKFVSGCYCNLSLDVYCWDNEYGRGLSFGLNHVQWVKEGPSLSTGAGKGAPPPVAVAFNAVKKAAAKGASIDDMFSTGDDDTEAMFG